MEAEWQADRSALRDLIQTRPDLPLKEMARRLKRSYSWAKDWAKRFKAAPPNDLEVLNSRSRARHTPHEEWDSLVVRRIEQFRLHPPEGLQRTPGPKALLYYLPRDAELKEKECQLPKSTSTVWRILKRLKLIAEEPVVVAQEGSFYEEMEEIQADWKDDGVPPDKSDDGKKQHAVETCNFLDAASSRWLLAVVRDDFHAQTALEAVIEFLQQYGRPGRFSFDHDPRWVGGPGGWDFPSTLQQFLIAVGVGIRLCPPHQPQKNGFVERLHRTYKEECLQIHQPQSMEEVKRVTEEFRQHYNYQRPHQGRSCQNQPPFTAFPTLPKLPPLPEKVQADRWLWRYHHRVFARQVGSDGCVTVNQETYYVSTKMAGQKVSMVVDAPTAAFDVMVKGEVVKRLSIKGVIRGEMSLEKFITLMLEQARSEERERQERKKRLWQRTLWDLTP